MKTCVLCLLLAFAFAAGAQSRTAYEAVTVVGTPNGKSAQLTWKKGSENVLYFIVERSSNGVDFTQRAIVFTSEDPAFSDYEFREKIGDTSQGLVYRIAVVNNQKRIFYLPPKTLIAPESL